MTYTGSYVLKRAAIRRKKNNFRRFTAFTAVFALILIIVTASLSIRSFADEKSPAGSRTKYYKSIEIKKGDTLSGIAASYISSEYSGKKEYINEVVKINSLDDINDIHAGDHLIIPYYYAMK
ncbi:MAG: LysM peptidoglycan-binding domain-containing protein [Lachnospiraceae bacterium]|nr:LysM peptidoglycan-binding domain-containing protein [Lachnospiraceae bacterium]